MKRGLYEQLTRENTFAYMKFKGKGMGCKKQLHFGTWDRGKITSVSDNGGTGCSIPQPVFVKACHAQAFEEFLHLVKYRKASFDII